MKHSLMEHEVHHGLIFVDKCSTSGALTYEDALRYSIEENETRSNNEFLNAKKYLFFPAETTKMHHV